MKNFNKKILMSVLTLVLTVIALGTTTFAWFSLSTVSKINHIEGTVTGGDGLELRLVGTNAEGESVETDWKANLSKGDVEAFIDNLFGGQKFDAVTTTNPTGTFTKMGTNDDGDMVLGTATTANVDYMEFTIDFRSQAPGNVVLSNIELDGTAFDYPITGGEYLQYQGQTADGKLLVHTNPAYAARVSFDGVVIEHNEEDFDGVTVSGNHAGQTTGVVHGQYSFLTKSKGIILRDGAVEIEDPTAFDIASTTMHDEISETDGAGDTTYVVETALAGSGTLYEGSLVVRIWIEGWDADAYDSIFRGTLVVSMEFMKLVE